MRIVHSLGWYFPDSTGGTEVYVQGLARHLRDAGHEVLLVAPAPPGQPEQAYQWAGLPVFRFQVADHPTTAEVQGRTAPAGLERFQAWLKEQQADVYHQHSLTRGMGAFHLEAARSLGLRCFLTVHVPSVTCARGTMMRFGRTPCSGRIDPWRCTACQLQERTGLPAPLSLAAGAGLRGLSPLFGEGLLSGRPGTLLGLPAALARRRRWLLRASQQVERVVAVCQWLYDVLKLNGVPEEKLVLSRQGLTHPLPLERPARLRGDGPLRVVFLGRFSWVKGPHILAEAAAGLPGVEVTFHGVPTPGEDAYYAQLERTIADSPNLHFGGAIPPAEVVERLAAYDLLCVPSLWLETGPLVVLEAFAAGIPVLGSKLGGIAELVEHGVNGWLVRPDQDRLRSQLSTVADAPQHLVSMDRAGNGPRQARDVAADMLSLYGGTIAPQPVPVPTSRTPLPGASRSPTTA